MAAKTAIRGVDRLMREIVATNGKNKGRKTSRNVKGWTPVSAIGLMPLPRRFRAGDYPILE
jgi:hypothetical protein